MGQASSLNLRVPWDGFCETLGIPFPSRALPLLRTRCPLCGKDGLDLFNDNIGGGQWHHCRSCRSSGDMIELASRAWGVEPSDALARMAVEGVPVPEDCLRPDRVAHYVETCTQYRRRLRQLWDEARAGFHACRSPEMSALRRRYGLNLDASEERWRAGPGRLVGAIDREQVERAFCPWMRPGQHTSKSESRVFRGARWGEVLVCAYHDLPGRLRAFAFAGRGGRVPDDHVFRRCKPYNTRVDNSEAGLAGCASVEAAGDPHAVIAVDDWLLMLQVQVRHARTSMRPLPLVAWRDDGPQCRTRDAWGAMLPGKRVVFWAPRPDHRVMMQAVQTDGLVSTCGPVSPEREAVQHYMRDHPGTDLSRAILASARPWYEALRRMLVDDATRPRAAELLARMEEAGADVPYVMRRVGGGVARPDRVRAPRGVSLTAQRTVFEQHDRWVVTNRRRQTAEILNCTFRLTHAVRDRRSGEVWYRGSCRFKGREVPFLERASVIHADAGRFLRELVLGVGAGVVAYDPSYGRKLHQIAVLFHEPEFVEDDLYKWAERVRAGRQATETEGAPT